MWAAWEGVSSPSPKTGPTLPVVLLLISFHSTICSKYRTEVLSLVCMYTRLSSEYACSQLQLMEWKENGWLGKRRGMPVTGQTQLLGHELLPNTFQRLYPFNKVSSYKLSSHFFQKQGFSSKVIVVSRLG